MARLLLACGALVFFASASATSSGPFSSGTPIWSLNRTSNFVLLRSADFSLRAAPLSAALVFTAAGSPRPPAGTTQAKLLGAAAVYVNGVLVGAGPGHSVPTASQPVRALDVRPFLRAGGAANTIGIASFFAWHYAGAGEAPRVQALLRVTDGGGEYNLSATGAGWSAWPADEYFNPTGDAGVSWYPM